MKIIFAATPDISIPCLEEILNSSHEIRLIITMPDKPSGRGKKLLPGPIKKFCLENGLPFIQPESLKSIEVKNIFKEIKSDLLIVFAYGKIIPKDIFELPTYGSINIHTSILPCYRGAAPIQRAIINGDKSSGITFMKLSERLDEGPIIEFFKVAIEEEETSGSLAKKMAKVSSSKILQVIENIELNNVKYIEQDHSKASYANKLLKSESYINWNKKAEIIKNMINGFSPNPCAYSIYKKERINVHKAKLCSTKSREPGKILEFSGEKLLIGTKDLSVEILELSRPGKRKMSVADFYNGSRKFFKVGNYLT